MRHVSTRSRALRPRALVPSAPVDWFTAIATGLVAAAAWAVLTYAIERLRVESTFRKYAGVYIETRKFPIPGQYHREMLRITVRQNVLRVVFVESPGRSIQGEIVMNRQLSTSGEGQYDDVKEQEQLWGFWDVQVKDKNTLLVHTSYASTHDTQALQGYIWRRLPSFVFLDPPNPLPRIPLP